MQSLRGVVPVLLGLLLVGGTAYQTWQFEQSAAALHTNEDRLERQFASLELTVADVRTAQAGYVAAGQGADFWMSRVDELVARIEAVLSERQLAGLADAVTPLAAAQSRLESLRVSDRRARNYVWNDQHLLASDVIFVESLEILDRLAAEIATARDAEIQANRQEATTIRQYQVGLAGGVAVLLLVLIAVPKSRGSEGPESRSAEVPEVPEVRSSEVSESRSAEVRGMTEAADVCVDLARLLDGRDLPALLSRTATAIGAKGVVLWVIDDARETLRPSLAHGYSERMMARLGTLTVGADNVTSVACRTLQPQVVPAASAEGSGAIAVPLIGTSGCVGVLAAEVSGSAADGSTLPLARVIAAQLAAVITPLPTAVAGATTDALNAPPAAGAL